MERSVFHLVPRAFRRRGSLRLWKWRRDDRRGQRCRRTGVRNLHGSDRPVYLVEVNSRWRTADGHPICGPSCASCQLLHRLWAFLLMWRVREPHRFGWGPAWAWPRLSAFLARADVPGLSGPWARPLDLGVPRTRQHFRWQRVKGHLRRRRRRSQLGWGRWPLALEHQGWGLARAKQPRPVPLHQHRHHSPSSVEAAVVDRPRGQLASPAGVVDAELQLDDVETCVARNPGDGRGRQRG
jgi:hypothetical protein